MPIMDPFEGAKSEREDANRQLLEAVATAGAEGKRAYQTARDAANSQRQSALDRAGQQAQMTGQNFGPAPMNPVVDEANRFNTYFQGQEAAGQQHLQDIGASGSSYLAKVGAIAPFMQQKALDQAGARENEYKMSIAQNQAKIDADKAARERDYQHDFAMLAARDRADAKSSAAKSRADSVEKITLSELVGLANQQPNVYKDSGNILGSVKGQNAIAAGNLAQRAGTIGGQIGMSPAKLAGLQTPDFQRNLMSDLAGLEGPAGAAPLPPPISKDWITQNVIMPGTKKTATGSRADDVLKAPEIGQAVEFLTDLGGAKIERGRLNDPLLGSDFTGMSPKDAFNAYIDSLPGILTMKAALKQYYAPYLDNLGR